MRTRAILRMYLRALRGAPRKVDAETALILCRNVRHRPLRRELSLELIRGPLTGEVARGIDPLQAAMFKHRHGRDAVVRANNRRIV